MNLTLATGKTTDVPQNILDRLRNRYAGDVDHHLQAACDATEDVTRYRPTKVGIGNYLNNWVAKHLQRRTAGDTAPPATEPEWKPGQREYLVRLEELKRKGTDPRMARRIASKETGFKPWNLASG